MHDDNTHPVRWGVELTPDAPVSAIGRLAADVEAVGLDAAFISNHYGNRDPIVALTRCAGETDRIRLGPGVVNPYETHPVRLASQLATLNELSDGRAVFGIGAGDRSTLRTMGIDRDRPLAVVRESIHVVRTLLAGERSNRSGTIETSAASLNYPTDPAPIYLGAQGPQMLAMGASVADGILFNGATLADYHEALPDIRRGIDQRPDDHGPVSVLGFASVSVDEDREEARFAARKPVAYIVAGAPDPIAERHDLDPDAVSAVRDALEANDRESAYDRVTESMIDAFCIAGTPDAVAARLETLTTVVDGIVAASPLGPDRPTAIDLLGGIVREFPDGAR